ncbi:hypothetical protein EYF80_027000 [Liparis tanakae]|uniref:Helitron helicase-like domain-containing protein n=1 Tax=Liparis tanakae TaxID=230148 RepID=A0A4Z2HD09_9TELE|nr:hypothetical protein EYF80_027000 [Liparis tanakae]
MSWEDKCKWLRNNPVTAARQFQHRLEAFFREFIGSKSNPIGELQDFMIRVEFQARGSPHAHTILWIKDAPKIGINTDEEVAQFVDRYQSCSIPEGDDELRELVTPTPIRAHAGEAKTVAFGFPIHQAKPVVARPPAEEDPVVAARLISEKQEILLKKASRTVVFVNTAPKEKRVAILKPKAQLMDMDDDSESVYCTSLLDRYAARPQTLEAMSLAEFATNYSTVAAGNTDDADDHQPAVLSDDDAQGDEHQAAEPSTKIQLQGGLGQMRRRRKPCVIRSSDFRFV